MMRILKAQGIALIYISHKMDEIFEICDEVSVLRDGNLVMTKPTRETDMNELIAAMVGRSLESRFPPVDNTPRRTGAVHPAPFHQVCAPSAGHHV